MDGRKNTDPQDHDVRRRFLEEGARSYVDAMTALIEYQREVQNKCREVLERHLGEYSVALGVEMTRDGIRDYAYPNPEEWVSMWANLGAKLPHVTRSLGVAWSESYCALGWDYEVAPPWFGAWVGISVPKKLSGFLHKELVRVGTKDVSQEPLMVFVGRKLEGELIATFHETVEELLRHWIDSWVKLGGLKAVALRSGSTSAGQADAPESDEPG
jgi:hypothetical protein